MTMRTTLVLIGLALIGTAAGLAQAPAETPEQILGKAEARLLAWDTAGARELMAKLPNTTTPAAKTTAGRLLAQEGKLGEATNQLSTAAAAAPNDPSPAIYLGEVHRLAGRSVEAQAAFEQAAQRAATGLKTTPDNVRLLVALGVARQNLRQVPEAITALSRARELAPGNVEATYQLGVSHALARNWAQSVDLLSQALQQNSQIAYGYFYRALAAEKVGRKDLLINDLERFLALAPNAPDAPRARRLLSAIRG